MKSDFEEVVTADLEKELIDRFVNGDKSAFDQLVKPHIAKLMNMTMQGTKNKEDAEDILQETLLKAHNALPKFRADSQIYTWLYRIAINARLNFYERERRRMREFHDSFDSVGSVAGEDFLPLSAMLLSSISHKFTEESPEYCLRYVECEHVLNEALEEVAKSARSPDFIKPFLMYEMGDDVSYEEIAEALNTPVGTVRSRISRVRDRVAEFMAKKLDDDKGHLIEHIRSRGYNADENSEAPSNTCVP